MLSSEKVAIAAHLHVLLRRKTGRVTDTEWMASNAEYAAEIIRFARASAKNDGHTELAPWADKLEAAMAPVVPKQPRATALFGPNTRPQELTADSTSSLFVDRTQRDAEVHRYVGGIR